MSVEENVGKIMEGAVIVFTGNYVSPFQMFEAEYLSYWRLVIFGNTVATVDR